MGPFPFLVCFCFCFGRFWPCVVTRRATSPDPKPSWFLCFLFALLVSFVFVFCSGRFRVRWGWPPDLPLHPPCLLVIFLLLFCLLCLFCFVIFLLLFCLLCLFCLCSCGLRCVCCFGFCLWTKTLFTLQFWCFVDVMFVQNMFLQFCFWILVLVVFLVLVSWSWNVFCAVFVSKETQ